MLDYEHGHDAAPIRTSLDKMGAAGTYRASIADEAKRIAARSQGDGYLDGLARRLEARTTDGAVQASIRELGRQLLGDARFASASEAQATRAHTGFRQHPEAHLTSCVSYVAETTGPKRVGAQASGDVLLATGQYIKAGRREQGETPLLPSSGQGDVYQIVDVRHPTWSDFFLVHGTLRTGSGRIVGDSRLPRLEEDGGCSPEETQRLQAQIVAAWSGDRGEYWHVEPVDIDELSSGQVLGAMERARDTLAMFAREGGSFSGHPFEEAVVIPRG